MDDILQISAGLGLSAACGFRVFLPPLLLGLAASQGWAPLPENFAWLASRPGLLVLGTATAAEAAAFLIPWVDNALDAIAAPAAVAAGALVAAPFASDLPAVLQWTLAIIAGGGAAGLVHAGSAAGRAASSTTTGGITNPAYALVESGASVFLSVLSLLLPVLALAFVLAAFGAAAALLLRLRRRRAGAVRA